MWISKSMVGKYKMLKGDKLHQLWICQYLLKNCDYILSYLQYIESAEANC